MSKANKTEMNKKSDKTKEKNKKMPKSTNKSTTKNANKGTDKSTIKNTAKGKKLKIAFLGGIGEIGKNMTVLEYGNDMIIVDAGLTFADPVDTPGVESIIPDYAYVKANASKIKGIFVTHGHEDHIGGLPYLLEEVKAPVYGSRLSLGILEPKLKERKINGAKLVSVTDDVRVFQAGAFTVEFVRVTHSIAGSYALYITVRDLSVFMTGDFKIDHTPIDGRPTDLTRIAEIGNNGVTLLMMDSTNVERNGYSMSERKVFASLDAQFAANKDKRIIVATFASNVHRVQQIVNCAFSHNRRVIFLGSSMIKIAEIARKLGELKYSDEMLTTLNANLPYDRVCIICTGTQGEEQSALTRMSHDNFKGVQIDEQDCVMFSSSAIPGNEKTIFDVINRLSKHGASVVYNALSEIHVSGHACKEELRLMFNLLKPKFFIPMHGEYRHLMIHKDLAEEMGVGSARVFIPYTGACVELDKTGIKRLADVPSGRKFITGNEIADNEESVKERKIMSLEGAVDLFVKTTLTNGEVELPVLITHGLELSERLILEIKNDICSQIATGELEKVGLDAAKKRLEKSLERKMKKTTGHSPLITVIVRD